MYINNLVISKERKFFLEDGENKIDYSKFAAFIANSDECRWAEDTEKGREILQQIDEFSAAIRAQILDDHQKKKAYAFMEGETGEYEMSIRYCNDRSQIAVEMERQRPAVLRHLLKLWKLAD
ncbi:hypothetical protein CLV59_107360 [Chitinophaga dinghuensis]|uniref:Uncharacterized protein n=1 Tax=Chitinophaga dinghuensis TaxID=1539050 RepID=A0A327VRC2_9BACT|nr:hypothetical protein [Chitinophaga dinghuensis]RAJ77593.1 hypothetical protein CLV59_107360 [Chitinophaga dinghuensis]